MFNSKIVMAQTKKHKWQRESKRLRVAEGQSELAASCSLLSWLSSLHVSLHESERGPISGPRLHSPLHTFFQKPPEALLSSTVNATLVAAAQALTVTDKMACLQLSGQQKPFRVLQDGGCSLGCRAFCRPAASFAAPPPHPYCLPPTRGPPGDFWPPHPSVPCMLCFCCPCFFSPTPRPSTNISCSVCLPVPSHSFLF